MTNAIEILLQGRKDASFEAAFKSAQRDLDALAAKWKSTPLTPKVEVKPINDAKARITELERTLQSWQRVAARGGTIMPGDLSQIHAAKAELESLKRGMADLQGAGGNGTAPISNRGFGKLGDALQGAGLGGLAGAASVAGIAAMAAGAAKATIDLGNLGQQVQQQRAYFEVWSGGVAQATDNLEAMRRAVGNSMTDSEAMTGANRMLSMGLAKNADDLERLSRMAVMLGGSTRSANESIEEFSLLLANQSILRLDTFGISGAKVRARIEELQAATPGLTRETAFLTAVMEEGARKVDALQAAGVKATTATQDLGAAFRGLKEATGEGINIAGIQSGIASGFAAITDDIRAGSGDAQLRLQGLTGQLERLKTELATLDKTGAGPFGNYAATAEQLRAAMAQLQTQIDYLRSATTQWGDVGVGANERAQAALLGTQGAVGDVNSELGASQAYWDAWAAFAEGAAVRARLAVSSASDQAWAARSERGRAPEPTVYASNRSALEMQAQGRVRTADIYDNLLTEEERLADERDRLAETNAKHFQTEYERAGQTAVNTFKGYLQRGMSEATGLFDLRQDLFKPGANGAFENLYRALDVAKRGDQSPWASALGLTQEQARKIGADFQRGIFSPEVMGLVNIDQLVNEARMAELAEKTQAAFAQSIAQKAGVKSNVVSAMFGYGGAGAGQPAGAVAEKQIADAMSQVAVSIGNSIKGKDFVGKVIGFGSTLFSHFEQGIVSGARESTALQAAFDLMAANALRKAGGGSAQNAARSSGVPGV